MKKILNIVIILFVLFSVCCKQVLAEDSLETQPQKEDDFNLATSRVFNTGLTPDMISHKDKSTGKFKLLKASNTEDLPDKFDLRSVVEEDGNTYNYTAPVKNQGELGTCWSFAICASAESYYKKKYSFELDLSEMHLAWYTYNNIGCSDPLNLIPYSGTKLKDVTKPKDILNAGSNPLIATYALSSGIGYINEVEMPYSTNIDGNTDTTTMFPNNECYKSDYFLTNADWYSISSEEDIKNVKKNLMKNGAIMAYVHVDANILTKGNQYIFTSSEATTSNEANHAITIVGWDDTISAETFAKNGNTPSIDGAWIIQNSYGELFQTMYLSYDEYSTKSNFAASFKIESNNQNKYHIYQYDGNALSTYKECLKDTTTKKAEYTVANMYTAQENEQVDYVGLFTYQPNVKVTVRVFDLNSTVAYPEIARDTILADSLNEDVLPNTVKYICGKTLTIENAGYHTIDFRGDIRNIIPKGDIIYATVKYSVDNSNLLLPIEKRTLTEEEQENNAAFEFSYQTLPIDELDTIAAQSGDNTKYMIHSQGYTNENIASKTNNPDNLEETGYARIKVISTSASNKINYVYPTGDEGDVITTTPSNPTEYIYNDGFGGEIGDGEITLYPATWKDNSNNIKREFEGWYTDQEYSTKLENNKFSTAQNEELTFYAGFKQRVIVNYGNNNDKNKIYHLLPNEKFQFPYNEIEELTTDSDGNQCEFKNWKYTINGEPKTALPNEEINLGITINGPDIIIEPEWAPITPNSDTQETVTPGELKVASDITNSALDIKLLVNSVSLDNLFTNDDKTEGGIIWVEAKKEEDTTKCNLFDTGNTNNIVLSCIDINIFKKNSDSSINKVYNLVNSAPISVNLSNESELKEAAENNKLLIYAIHNGKQSEQPIIPKSYDFETGILTFNAKEFSLFGFAKSDTTQGTYSNKPIESTTPTGETDNSNKAPETKETNDTNKNQAYPDFKPANTGIY